MDLQVKHCDTLRGELEVAPDKSISHRSIILGALAEGKTEVKNLLEGEDVLATIGVFRQMGVNIQRTTTTDGYNHYTIDGVGLNGLSAPQKTLDLGNSGTAFRLVAGLLCAQPWSSELSGDESLCRRPMKRIIDPLSAMGAHIQSNNGCPPVTIKGADDSSLTAIDYNIPVVSAQVKSAILLAAMYAKGETKITECGVTRDHTERMMRAFGYSLCQQGRTLTLSGGGRLDAQDIVVPGDLSSSAFFMLAGLVVADSKLTLRNIGNNPSRNGVIGILQRMNGAIEIDNPREVSGEPVCDLHIRHSDLQGVELNAAEVALAIDEIPVIAVAAAFAKGETVIRGAAELRVKESDRIAAVVHALRNLNISVAELEDGMVITGGVVKQGVVDSYDDHRIAMAFLIAGAAGEGVTVNNCQNIATSFPNFIDLMRHIGVNIH